MSSLYELSHEYAELLNDISICDEVTAEQEKRIDELNDSVENKIINVAKYIMNLEYEYEAMENSLKKINDRGYKKLSALHREINRKKDYIQNAMRLSQLQKVFSPDFDISIVKNPPKTDVYNEEIIPEKYFVEVIQKDRYINRKSLAEDLKKGVDVPGAKIVQETRLKIY
jgi:hypothetical protein